MSWVSWSDCSVSRVGVSSAAARICPTLTSTSTTLTRSPPSITVEAAPARMSPREVVQALSGLMVGMFVSIAWTRYSERRCGLL